jgi:mannose-6-phosphate isomerase
MHQIALYPLRFEPLYQYRLWGGRRLSNLLSAALPDGPVGEAWLLSDRDDHSSVIANGPLKGQTLGQILNQWPTRLLGSSARGLHRFPLLLKLLDVRTALSVQVHPSDTQTTYLPAGESGKTEAWVVLATEPESRIYAGLTPNSTMATIRESLANGAVADHLASFTPKVGDGIFIPAGTVHSLRDLVVFEVQENSDVTFRLYDWNHVDAKTRQPRHLQVEQALACIDFRLWRVRSEAPFTVGAAAMPRVLACIDGEGHVKYDGADYPCAKGDVVLLPAAVGSCLCQPRGSISLLEISLPQGA